jgi:hypothetical protein
MSGVEDRFKGSSAQDLYKKNGNNKRLKTDSERFG